MAIPIWKDTFAKIPGAIAGDKTEFRISIAGHSELGNIYTGVSVIRPGTTSHKVRINDICSDYMSNALPLLSQAEFSALSFPIDFEFYYYDITREVFEVWDNYQFINDWSYDYAYNPNVDGMSFPINNRVDGRQWMVYTGLGMTDVTLNLTFQDGTTNTVIIPLAISADFNIDYNNDFARSVRSAGSGTAVFDLSQWQNLARVSVNGIDYDVTSCNRYALYYLNVHGGWDTFLIEGNYKERDEVTRSVREVTYDNSDIKNRGRINYSNAIDKRLVLHTSWLSDEQSLRMHNLLNSTDVYLYDMDSAEMIPVIISGTTTEYKTYKNNGGKLVNYTIEVEYANWRNRR